MLSGHESEMKWVDEHPEYYNGKQHQDSVKRAIYTRYFVNELTTAVMLLSAKD